MVAWAQMDTKDLVKQTDRITMAMQASHRINQATAKSSTKHGNSMNASD